MMLALMGESKIEEIIHALNCRDMLAANAYASDLASGVTLWHDEDGDGDEDGDEDGDDVWFYALIGSPFIEIDTLKIGINRLVEDLAQDNRAAALSTADWLLRSVRNNPLLAAEHYRALPRDPASGRPISF